MRILSNLSVSGLLGLNSVADANTDTDKFLVLDSSGIVRYRTGAEVFSDIGAGGAAAYTSVLQHTVKAGETLTKGQAVYVTSADGTNMIVGKASNDTEATSSKTLGLIAQNLATNDQGFVITEGLLAGLDTSTASAGDPVWLGTGGNLLFGLANKPYAPTHMVFIGIVTRAQQNNGEIFVKVQNGFELQELHNVQVTSTPSDNTVLSYETSTSLYKMKSIPTLLGYTPVTNARNITINGTTYDLSADRTWSVGTHTGSLTTGYIPKATGTTTLTDGLMYDTGSAILIGTQTAGSGKFMVYSTSPDNHYQAVGSAPSFRFADTITSPNYTGIFGLATASNHFIIGAAAGDMVLSNNTTSAIGNFLFGTGATERMRISPAGNVSINNTNNTYRFDVTGTVRFTGQLRLESTITNGTHTYTLPSATGTLALTSDIPSLSGYVPTSRTITINGVAYDLSADRSWTVSGGVSGTGTTNYLPKFTGTSTIGNSAVSDDGSTVALNSRGLNVSGASTLTGRVTSVEVGVTKDGADTIGDGPWFRWTNAAANRQMLTQLNASNGLTTWAFNGTSWSSLLTLTQSGNLGLGVNPSAWGSNRSAIQFGALGAVFSDNNVTSEIGANVYISTAPAYTYITSNFATRFAQINGQFQWHQAPSGTAGNAISFTQAMTLNASGNLSIGNTNNTYKLDVTGTARFTGQVDSETRFYVVATPPATNGGLINVRDTVTATNVTSFAGVFFNSSPGNDYSIGKLTENNSGFLQIRNANSGAELLRINASGAATFSSSVTANSNSTINGSGVDVLVVSGNGSTNTMRATSVGGAASRFINIVSQVSENSNQVDIRTHGSTYTETLFGNSMTNAGAILGQPAAGAPFVIGNYNNGALVLGTNNAERLRITSGGNVGIGVTNPSYIFQTQDMGTGSSNAWFGTGTVRIGGGADAGSNQVLSLAPGRFGMDNPGVANGRFIIEENGRVGIGTASPSGKLHVVLPAYTNEDTDSQQAIFGSGTSGYGVRIGYNESTNTGYINSLKPSVAWSNLQINASNIIFAPTATERMRITSGGNVGIGTTSPSQKLEVAGVIRGEAVNVYGSTDPASTSPYLFSPSTGTLGIGANGSERMRITSGGNVVIGGTNAASRFNVRGPNSNSQIEFDNFGSGVNFILSYDRVAAAYKDIVLITNASNNTIYAATSGNVGIGTTSPQTELHVKASSGWAEIRIDGASGSAASLEYYSNGMKLGDLYCDTSANMIFRNNVSNERMRITNVGDVLINATMTTQMAKFYVNGKGAFGSLYIANLSTGTVYSNMGNLTNTNPSDIRLKNTIKPLTYGLNEVLQLNPKTFYYNDDATRARLKYGFIAQEVKEVMPDLVRRLGSDNDYLGLETEGIYVALVNAIKESHGIINKLKERIEALESK